MTTELERSTRVGTRAGRKRRGLTFRLLAVLIAIAAVLVVLEIALQVVYYVRVGSPLFAKFAQPLYAPNASCVYRLRPNVTLEHRTQEFAYTIHTNAQGFRTSDPSVVFEVPKPEDVYRVLLLGPSFAFGWGVEFEQGIGSVIEREMNSRGMGQGKRVELINAGVPALPPASQLAWFKAEGHVYDPDLVVQIAYGSLAIDPSLIRNISVTPQGYLVQSKVPLRARLMAMAKRSAFVHTAWTAYQRLPSTKRSASETSRIEGAGQEMRVHAEFDVDDPDVISALGYYNDLRQEMDRVDSSFVILHFPLSYCVHREDMSRWSHLGVRDVDVQNRFNQQFCDHLNATGVPCANITPELISASESSDDRLYFWLDVHFTVLGNTVAGQAFVDQLEKQESWLAPRPSP